MKTHSLITQPLIRVIPAIQVLTQPVIRQQAANSGEKGGNAETTWKIEEGE